MSAAPPRIGDYALLGDTRSAALVSPTGDIDWWCVPRFDSNPLCGRLVGGPDTGHFSLGPAEPATIRQRDYLPGTPVLRTQWQCSEGQLTLTDGMVAVVRGKLLPSTLLVRRLEAGDQPVRVQWAFSVRHGWAREVPHRRAHRPATVFTRGGVAMSVHPSLPLPTHVAAEGELTLQARQHLTVESAPSWANPSSRCHRTWRGSCSSRTWTGGGSGARGSLRTCRSPRQPSGRRWCCGC